MIALSRIVYGPWQLGQMGPEQYAHEAKRWAHALKCVDPSIELISSGDTVGDHAISEPGVVPRIL